MKIQIDVPAADHARLLALFREVGGEVHKYSLIEYAADIFNLGIEMAESLHQRELERGPEACPFTPDPK